LPGTARSAMPFSALAVVPVLALFEAREARPFQKVIAFERTYARPAERSTRPLAGPRTPSWRSRCSALSLPRRCGERWSLDATRFEGDPIWRDLSNDERAAIRKMALGYSTEIRVNTRRRLARLGLVEEAPYARLTAAGFDCTAQTFQAKRPEGEIFAASWAGLAGFEPHRPRSALLP